MGPAVWASSTKTGLDGIGLVMVLLTTLLSAIAIVSSLTAIHDRVKEYYVFLLVLETGMTGVFAALDLILFYVFWEAMLVPMYFLIGVWGGPRRVYATIKFVLYTLVGSLLMLVAILAIHANVSPTTLMGRAGGPRHSTWSTSSTTARGSSPPCRRSQQFWLFLCLRAGVRDQGADLPAPHLAAGRAHRGADGRARSSWRACC